MIPVDSYQVQVRSLGLGVQRALLRPADFMDMPDGWDFDWKGFWGKTDFEFQGIAKLSLRSQILGLVRYSIFPTEKEEIKNVLVEHIEALPTSRGQEKERLFEPIGKWLLWYVIQIAFSCCADNSKEPSDYLIVLESLDSAVDYYRDSVGMEYLGLGSGSPGDDLYIFAFSWHEASAFCSRQESEYGLSQKLT